jgi:hypothetical protein
MCQPEITMAKRNLEIATTVDGAEMFVSTQLKIPTLPHER